MNSPLMPQVYFCLKFPQEKPLKNEFSCVLRPKLAGNPERNERPEKLEVSRFRNSS